jgi:hypothetical protein
MHRKVIQRIAGAVATLVVAVVFPASAAAAAGADAHASCLGLGLSNAAPGVIAPEAGLTPKDVAGIAAFFAHERKDLSPVPGHLVAPTAQIHAGNAQDCFAE